VLLVAAPDVCVMDRLDDLALSAGDKLNTAVIVALAKREARAKTP